MAKVEGTGTGAPGVRYTKDGTPLFPAAPGNNNKAYNPLWWLDQNKNTSKSNTAGNLPGSKPKTPATSGSGGSGSGSYGGGGGSGGGIGGGGSGTGTGQRYLEDYQLKFFKDGKPPADILQKAIKDNWSLAYFEQRVRLGDPKYYKSTEARLLLPKFNKTMKILFPGLADMSKQAALMKSPFYKRTAMWYLKNGIGKLGDGGMDMLYGKITNTKRWNKYNPEYKAYIKNRNASVQAEANPIVFKQLGEAMKNAFKKTGIEIGDDYFSEFVKSRYASSSGISDLSTNLGTIASTSGAFNWFQGEPTSQGQVKTAAFNANKAGTDLRSRMNKAFGIEKGFKGSQEQGFGASMNEQGKLVKKTI